MKRILDIFLLISVFTCSAAQEVTNRVTVYPDFRPAVIRLVDGRTLHQSRANVFLKNGALLYMKGSKVLQANMKTVAGVTFPDCNYVRIDSVLACPVDSVGPNVIFRASHFDMEAYQAMIRHNTIITSVELGDVFGITTVDPGKEEAATYPLIHRYFILYNGQMVRAEERALARVLSKEQRRVMRSVTSLPDYSWNDVSSLRLLLEKL